MRFARCSFVLPLHVTQCTLDLHLIGVTEEYKANGQRASGGSSAQVFNLVYKNKRGFHPPPPGGLQAKRLPTVSKLKLGNKTHDPRSYVSPDASTYIDSVWDLP